ncbi:MAG TPA: hypothetical protein VF658_08045 [Pyrinomonadaceae bacterium]|jgi:hypothetical protein
MSDDASTGRVTALTGFLFYLREQGFEVGVTHYVSVQRLLDKVEIEHLSTPERLETLLCPIFATTKEQQAQFYKAFRNYAETISGDKINGRGDPDPRTDPPPTSRKKQLLAIGAALISVSLISYVIYKVTRPQSSTNINANRNTSPSPPGGNAEANTSVPANNNPGVVGANSTGANTSIKPANINRPPASNDGNTNSAPQSAQPPPPQQHSWMAFFLFMFLVLLCFFLLYEFYRRIRRWRSLKRQRRKFLPHTWPLAVTRPLPALYDTEEFRKAARYLRRRQVSEFHRLDIKATVAATIKALGLLVIRDSPDSKPPEYLILIERVSEHDHQARLFEELAHALKRENVFVTYYFYETDPRVCSDQSGDVTVRLTELLSKYSDHRLLIFADGGALINPQTGELESWTKSFLNWHERSLLTPSQVWGVREFKLRERFILLPATTRGLLALADHFDTALMQGPDSRQPPSGMNIPLSTDELLSPDPLQVVNKVRWHLGEGFRWLCACAVYARLQWDLTLYLASLSFFKEGVINEETVLRLVSLPWFRRGEIPDDIRWQLVRELKTEEEKEVRAALVHFLESPESQPPAETLAADTHLVQLLTQIWLYRHDRRGFRELVRLLKKLPLSYLYRDRTLVRFIRHVPNSILAERLSPRLRTLFYRRGLPGFGPSRAFISILTLLLSIGLTAMLYPMLKDKEIPLLNAFSYTPPLLSRLFPLTTPVLPPSPAPEIAMSTPTPPPPDTPPGEPAVGPTAVPTISPTATTTVTTPPATPTATPPVQPLQRRTPVSPTQTLPPGTVTVSQYGMAEGYATAGYVAQAREEEAEAMKELKKALDADPQAKAFIVITEPENEDGKLEFIYPPDSSFVEDALDNAKIDSSRVKIIDGGTVKDKDKSGVTISIIPGDAMREFDANRIFDQYGDITWGDETTRLDNFLIQLQNDPQSQGYIIVYAGRVARANEAQSRLDRAKDYLVNIRGIDPGRLITIDGGYKDDVTVELWVVPPDGTPPAVTPTVNPSDVQIITRPRSRRSSRRGT